MGKLTENEKLLVYLLKQPNGRADINILRERFPGADISLLCVENLVSRRSPRPEVYQICITSKGSAHVRDYLDNKKKNFLSVLGIIVAVVSVIATVAVGFKDDINMFIEIIISKLLD